MSDLQIAVDAASAAGGARRQADLALILLARHLRRDHRWGRRRIARWFGWTETYVKNYIEAADAG